MSTHYTPTHGARIIGGTERAVLNAATYLLAITLGPTPTDEEWEALRVKLTTHARQQGADKHQAWAMWRAITRHAAHLYGMEPPLVPRPDLPGESS